MPPQFLVIGHIVQDLTPDERAAAPAWRLGGTVSYAALLATRLGLDTAVLTAAAADLALEEALPGAEIVRVPSPESTQIRNVYTAGGRVQYIPQRAAAIKPGSLPDDWRRAEIVLLGPVAGEVDDALAACFPQGLLGVSAQGWLRDIGPDGRVRPLPPQRWRAETVLRPAHVLFVADEDFPPSRRRRAVLTRWSRQVEVLAYTRAERGAEICHRGTWRHIDAFPAQVVDATGPGDIFATAFLIHYREAGDPWEAARFAACAASFVVEAEGLANTPDRAMIEARLRANPDIMAK
ncbi:MAG: ribokinase [Dehalococcoidia bacterium]|nr:MAG: ribokinase [Dehalococcoidia bacterium]